MFEGEKKIEEELGLKYCTNFPITDYEKRRKALDQSKAIGKIVRDESLSEIRERLAQSL